MKHKPTSNQVAITARSANPMRGEEALTCLIGHIYDAAVDSTRWADALARGR